MTKKGELGVAHIFYMNNNHFWLVHKILKLKRGYDNPDEYFAEFNLSKQEKMFFRESIKIDIITSVVQYAELFGIYMICFHMGNPRFHKTILNYNVGDVISFYQNIKNRRLSYIRKILGYPPIHRIRNNKEHCNNSNKSCQRVKSELVKLAEFYKKHREVYNSYKHGLRVFPILSEPPDSKSWTAPVILNKKLDSITFLKLDIAEAIKLLNFMSDVLQNSLETFKQRRLEKKEQFTVHFYL